MTTVLTGQYTSRSSYVLIQLGGASVLHGRMTSVKTIPSRLPLTYTRGRLSYRTGHFDCQLGRKTGEIAPSTIHLVGNWTTGAHK